MAEFCKQCCQEVMGINPGKYPEWVIEEGDLCEECGYDYLKEQKRERK